VVPALKLEHSWFLAKAFDHGGDVGYAVPLHSLARPPPSFDLKALRALGSAYPDQEVVGAMAGRRVTAKNAFPRGEVLFGTNHQSGLRSWFFVNKANQEFKKQGQLLGFPISVCPPVYPAFYSPTGAVHKKDRLGNVDPLNMRPTADYSWPASGHWMEWLTKSVNDSVDLDRDFPRVRYVTFQDIAERALQLRSLGGQVV
jgi:hypothetical protein